MQFFVRGVDGDGVAERLELLGEPHWAYMDGYVDDLVARGPTLCCDGNDHTGSIHVLSASGAEEAERFAFGEPYWLAGLYASVGVTRFHNALSGTMWDRPPPPGSTSSLVLVSWQACTFAPVADPAARLLRQLADTDEMVFGGVLISGDGATSTGLAAAFDVGVEQAKTIVAGFALPETATSIVACRWQRGGRDQA